MQEAESQTALKKDRKTTGVQKRGRAARVVNNVLRATCEELNDVGYAALRVEDVADRAGVNKTTIYRRWPTKNELIVDAIRKSYDQLESTPDTGELRQDLIDYIRLVMKRTQNPIARGAMLALNNCTDPAIKPLTGELLGKAREVRTTLVQRGIDRGELPSNTDPALVSDLFSAPILRKLLTLGEKVKMSYVEAVIDTVIAGTKAHEASARESRK